MTSAEVKPAPRIEADTNSEDAGEATVNFEVGSVFLIPAEPKAAPDRFRLVWRKGDKEKKRRVPAGKYRIKHYAIEKEHNGELWILSASGKEGPVVEIQKGKATEIKVDDAPRLGGMARWNKKVFQVGTCPVTSLKMTFTVARGTKLLAMKVEVLNKDGAVIKSSDMQYG